MLGKFAIWTVDRLAVSLSSANRPLVGLGLTQIGEFSYVLVRVARDAHLVTDDIYHATLAASVITILLNGLLMKALPRAKSGQLSASRLGCQIPHGRSCGANPARIPLHPLF